MDSLPMPLDPFNSKTIEDTLAALNRQAARRPSPSEVISEAQRKEAQHMDAVADALAQVHYGRSTIGDLSPREVAEVRYAALIALRRLSPAWHEGARKAAQTAAVQTIQAECGRILALLHDDVQGYIAKKLTSTIVTAYLGVLEGSMRLTPSEYYGVVTGGQR